jgi:hypothetical protein
MMCRRLRVREDFMVRRWLVVLFYGRPMRPIQPLIRALGGNLPQKMSKGLVGDFPAFSFDPAQHGRVLLR